MAEITQAENGLTFQRVEREPKLSDKVARLLLDSIFRENLQPGERLPSERELGDQFGVSRTVIREAVRSLAAKGVLEVRTGSGLRVAAVEAGSVSETFNLFLRSQTNFDYRNVHEIRAMVEIQVAGIACERATEDDLAGLRAICDRMEAALDDSEEAAELDVEFHRAIADATHNVFYGIMLDSIRDVLLEVRRRAINSPHASAERGLEHHRRILEAIEERDDEAARSAMEGHLEDSKVIWTAVAADASATTADAEVQE